MLKVTGLESWRVGIGTQIVWVQSLASYHYILFITHHWAQPPAAVLERPQLQVLASKPPSHPLWLRPFQGSVFLPGHWAWLHPPP